MAKQSMSYPVYHLPTTTTSTSTFTTTTTTTNSIPPSTSTTFTSTTARLCLGGQMRRLFSFLIFCLIFLIDVVLYFLNLFVCFFFFFFCRSRTVYQLLLIRERKIKKFQVCLAIVGSLPPLGHCLRGSDQLTNHTIVAL